MTTQADTHNLFRRWSVNITLLQTVTSLFIITLDKSVFSMSTCKCKVCSIFSISVSHVKCDFRLLGWSGGSETINIRPSERHGENSTGRSVGVWEKSKWKVCELEFHLVFECDVVHLASLRSQMKVFNVMLTLWMPLSLLQCVLVTPDDRNNQMWFCFNISVQELSDHAHQSSLSKVSMCAQVSKDSAELKHWSLHHLLSNKA